jgi:hypothetical protein
MCLNGLEREVDMVEPTRAYVGVYNAPANYAGSSFKLKRQELFAILASQGLDYSGRDHDIQHGFNDWKVMGVNPARRAKATGKSNVWIGLDGRVINLEITPATFMALTSQTHLEYAQGILDCVVRFVENQMNYRR